MGKRVIAIGDIHGCAAALRGVLAHISPKPDDILIVLGDCVDRGSDSRGVIEQLLSLRTQCQLVTLFGNHEEMMVNYLSGRPQPDDWLSFGGAETLASYRAQADPQAVPEEHIKFIHSWGDYWENETHFFVHGGYHPGLPLSEQRWSLHRWQSLREYWPEPHCSGKTAVVGHTAQKDGNVLDLGYLKCIDTYCHGGGWLTALDTTSGQRWQADRHGTIRE